MGAVHDRHGDTALAQERRANGRDKPWSNLKYVDFGDELWSWAAA